MSADLYWMVTRDTSSFMMKGRLSKGKIFTREPMNLTGLHSLTSSGTVGPKAIGITAAPDNKGVVVVTKKPKGGWVGETILHSLVNNVQTRGCVHLFEL